MKKVIILVLTIFMLVGCSHRNNIAISPEAVNKKISIDNFLCSPDGGKIAIKSQEELFIYDVDEGTLIKQNNKVYSLSDFHWTQDKKVWQLKKDDNDINKFSNLKDLQYTKNKLNGELFDKDFNENGNLEINFIKTNDINAIALVDKVKNTFNIVKDIDEESSINTIGLSKDMALIEIMRGNVYSLLLYSHSNGGLIEVTNKGVEEIYNTIKEQFKIQNIEDELYKKRISTKKFEILDLSIRNRLMLYINNESGKLMDLNMNTNKVKRIEGDSIIDAVSINQKELYLISKYDKKYSVIRANLGKNEYSKVFSTNEFIYKLWEYNGNVIFLGVTNKEGKNNYNFYKVMTNGVENIFINKGM